MQFQIFSLSLLKKTGPMLDLMEYDQFIIAINFACITILVLLAGILLAATRFKGENGYAAAIIVIPNVPVYLYNMSRMLGWHEFTVFMFPIGFSVNTMLMPLLWLFALKNFKVGFRFRYIQLLHFLPAIVCALLCFTMPMQEIVDSILYEMKGDDSWIGDVNTIIITIQLVTYFPAIFRFLYRRKKEIYETSSNAEWIQKGWIWQFMLLFAALFVTVMVSYAIWPRTDAWLIQILNVIAMSFLVYNTIAHPVISPQLEQKVVEESTDNNNVTQSLTDEQMREICEKASSYLLTTKAFLQPDITIALFAKQIDIPQRNLSRAINTYLNRNFFEFINEMRVEEAKRKLVELDAKGYNIDSIYSECGFRSRSTFFMVFKKITGKTPAIWLNDNQN